MKLMKEVYDALNQIVRTPYVGPDGQMTDTYALAAKVGELLKDVDSIPTINWMEPEVWVTDDVSAISMDVGYEDSDMVEHDMLYIMHETGEPSEGGVSQDEAMRFAHGLIKLTKHLNGVYNK